MSNKKYNKAILAIKKILDRLSLEAQDFICKCMQQRFSNNEFKKESKPGKIMTTSDMLTHPWILVTEEGGVKDKKKG